MTDRSSQGIVGAFAAHRVAGNLPMAVPVLPALLCLHESKAIAWRRGGAGGAATSRTAR